MPKKNTPAVVDPTLPFVPLTLDGKDYKLCLDFEAIAQVERQLRVEGHEISLLFAYWGNGLEELRSLFAVSLRIYQPDLPFSDALKLMDWGNSALIYVAMKSVREMFAAKPEEETEPKPAGPTTPGD